MYYISIVVKKCLDDTVIIWHVWHLSLHLVAQWWVRLSFKWHVLGSIPTPGRGAVVVSDIAEVSNHLGFDSLWWHVRICDAREMGLGHYPGLVAGFIRSWAQLKNKTNECWPQKEVDRVIIKLIFYLFFVFRVVQKNKEIINRQRNGSLWGLEDLPAWTEPGQCRPEDA